MYSDTIKINTNGAKMIAHRGLSKLELENTKEAFIAAGNRSYYGIETDVRLTKDNKLVVYHDDDLNRLAKLDKKVIELTLNELQNLVLDNDFNTVKSTHRFLEFEDYLKICKHYKKVPIIELKNGQTEDSIKRIYDLTMKYFGDDLNSFVFISFHFDYLLKLKELNNDLKIQFLFGKDFDQNLELCIKHNFDLDINYGLLTEENYNKIQKTNLKLNIWTMDDPNWVIDKSKYKIDFITSNILE